jgi:hypothetical protein
MGEDIELPRRGYDTKDVEAMTREQEAADGGARGKAPLVIGLVLVVAIAVWVLLVA